MLCCLSGGGPAFCHGEGETGTRGDESQAVINPALTGWEGRSPDCSAGWEAEAPGGGLGDEVRKQKYCLSPFYLWLKCKPEECRCHTPPLKTRAVPSVHLYVCQYINLFSFPFSVLLHTRTHTLSFTGLAHPNHREAYFYLIQWTSIVNSLFYSSFTSQIEFSLCFKSNKIAQLKLQRSFWWFPGLAVVDGTSLITEKYKKVLLFQKY